MNRRKFLKRAGGISAGLGLAALVGVSVEDTVAPPKPLKTGTWHRTLIIEGEGHHGKTTFSAEFVEVTSLHDMERRYIRGYGGA